MIFWTILVYLPILIKQWLNCFNYIYHLFIIIDFKNTFTKTIKYIRENIKCLETTLAQLFSNKDNS